MSGLIDTHVHLTDTPYETCIEAVLAHMARRGVQTGIIPGYSIEACRKIVEIQQNNPSVPIAVGLHPMFLDPTQSFLNELSDISRRVNLTAIGEIGLDNRTNCPPDNLQEEAFRNQLALAVELKLPVIIHCVGTHLNCLKTLSNFNQSDSNRSPVRGVIHRISCSREIARQYADLGFYFGLGPDLFDSRRTRLLELAAWLPEDRILLETDAPYSKKADGSICNPWDLVDVLACLAKLRKTSAVVLKDTITRNTFNLFGV